jgi:HAD superfamily hydrolase (TIGR01490 family)
MPTQLAIFDLDYTLLDKDSEILWLEFVTCERLAGEAFLKELEGYLAVPSTLELPIEEFQRLMLHPLTLYPWEVLQDLRRRYLQVIPGLVRPRMMQRVGWHREQGHMVLLATAANCFIAAPVAEMLAFENLLCTQIEQDGHGFTGNLSGLPAFQEGKATLVRQWVAGQGLSLEGSWAYSDSHNDLPLLSMVDHPVAVTPNAKLRAYALEHAWQIIE